ncbi:MAG TPA: 4-hydroxy-3-methylbut-2-enyl diphosphate reductase, partial [Verrucomicrobiae bacterium]|nr:4-hydroxy-3-methylbut-2-enyl diphosphate reductase [Verrucomicrobiae bacterium]
MQSEIDTVRTERPAVKIIRADHLGMCFGVRDAIALAVQESRRQPLTILGELAHNESVLGDLRARGVQIEKEVAAVKTDAVMITAHGASEMTLRNAQARGLEVIEATCPLVHHAHRALHKLVRDNFFPIIIGVRAHVEVRGMTEDLEEFEIVLTEEDVAKLEERPSFGVVAQTTQPVEKVRHLVDLIRRRFPRSEVEFIDTVCQPTKQRQTAAIKLASECDIVIVVGGQNSNNTRELAATCRKYCQHTYHVQRAEQLRPEWFEDATSVGITAGTSTPDRTIDEV